MTIAQPDQNVADSYAYKASLIGMAHRFELTEDGLSWQLAGRSGLWRFGEIASIRLSYRPVSMQSHRFRADIRHAEGSRIAILSTSWQSAALMAPQDNGYRAFIVALHERMAKAGSRARLIGGFGRKIYGIGVAFVTLVAAMMLALLVRSLLVGQFAGALFLVGFAILFGWQIGGFLRRNRPMAYSFDRIPPALLP
jgi:hypothetical protein